MRPTLKEIKWTQMENNVSGDEIKTESRAPGWISSSELKVLVRILIFTNDRYYSRRVENSKSTNTTNLTKRDKTWTRQSLSNNNGNFGNKCGNYAPHYDSDLFFGTETRRKKMIYGESICLCAECYPSKL